VERLDRFLSRRSIADERRGDLAIRRA